MGGGARSAAEAHFTFTEASLANELNGHSSASQKFGSQNNSQNKMKSELLNYSLLLALQVFLDGYLTQTHVIGRKGELAIQDVIQTAFLLFLLSESLASEAIHISGGL